MKETYCIVDKRVTPCTEPSGYQQDKRGRTQFFCRCAVCGNKKVRYFFFFFCILMNFFVLKCFTFFFRF